MNPKPNFIPLRSLATRIVLLCTSALFLSVLSAAAHPQAGAVPTSLPPAAKQQTSPVQAAASNPGVCGNQPFCYETADFAAVVTDFRTSKSGYFGLVATTLRFVNKTSSPLVLGYANGSGTAQDDQGLRYGVGGANALRGMGLVNGPTADAKFVLQPGGFGDARFELLARLGQIYGLTFELDITVNEINTLEGNQHTVGSEFPLHFQGLTNGVHGTAPGIPSGGLGMYAGGAAPTGGVAPACGPAGIINSVASATNSASAQNASNTATSTAANAASAISSITSLFGKKKQAVPAATNAAAVPCTPLNPTAATPAVNAIPKTTAAAPATTATNTPAATPAVVPAKPAVANAPAPKTPAQPAKPAVKKPVPATTPAMPPAQPK